ncbi:Urease accessory protein F, partial [Cucurbita argyrosperma subsp. sororia]
MEVLEAHEQRECSPIRISNPVYSELESPTTRRRRRRFVSETSATANTSIWCIKNKVCSISAFLLEYMQQSKLDMDDKQFHWSQWQLLDSILPTGGFAHSFGLEAAIQARIVSQPEDLKTFLNAILTNEVSRKASVTQGSALMRVAAIVFSEISSLKAMRETTTGTGAVSFHHAPIFGLICGLLGWDSTMSQRAYLFITLRDVISAATRLNLVGPLGAAVLQHQLALVAEDTLKKWMNRPVEEACQTVPLLETVQGCHTYLFSRLFCS